MLVFDIMGRLRCNSSLFMIYPKSGFLLSVSDTGMKALQRSCIESAGNYCTISLISLKTLYQQTQFQMLELLSAVRVLNVMDHALS